ncbi:MAG: cyclase family protein [Spirochaetales bacterium]|nr:cyclase family protein [Spirochaetales bacterium]
MREHSKQEQLQALLRSAKWVDLSPLLENGIPRWPTHPPVIISQTMTHEHDGFYCQNLSMPEHAGAHVDAPYHIHKSVPEQTIEKVPVDYLFGPCKIVHLEHLELEGGQMADAEAVLEWERRSGESIREGDIVFVNFGWLKRHWATDGRWSYYAMNQPGLTEDAAKLFRSRKIRAIGSDTAACGTPLKDGKSVLDEPPPIGCWIHGTLLSEGILLVECLANLEELPDACYFMALPLKTHRGSGSPIRAVGLVFDERGAAR